MKFKCRGCGNSFAVSRVDLGELYQSGFTDDITKEFPKASLKLVECTNCGLVQLEETAELDSMYKEYWYRSGLNPSMVNDLEDIVRSIEERVNLNDRPLVVDIGCNDGTMFDFYKKDVIKIGYDPSLNVGDSLDKCTHFVNDYFPSKDKPSILRLVKPTVITAIAMFYDLPDPDDFLREIKNMLADDGLFVVQFTDLYSMCKVSAFDNICHEHLEYYRLLDLDLLFKKRGLSIMDVEYNKVNGGSIRVYAVHSSLSLDPKWGGYTRVRNAIAMESGILSSVWNINFTNKIYAVKKSLRLFLTDAKLNNERVCGLGASTKGNTLLQVCGITTLDIESIGEINEDKYGLYTIGTWIPIVPEEELMENPPEYLLVLPWHFKNTFLKNFDDYMKKGGTLVFPLPDPVMYYYNKDGELTHEGI